MRRLLFLAISLSGAVETCSFSLLFQPGGTSSLSSAAAAVPSLGRGSSPLPPLVSALCPMGRSLPPLALLTMSADVRGGKTGSISRRSFVAGACIAAGSQAASARAPPGIGGGTDILSDIPPLNVDAVYPASCKGEWLCQRVVTLVEGDEGQALLSWKALGGTGDDLFAQKKIEQYATRFVDAPATTPCEYDFEGQSIKGMVLDRGFELNARVGGASVVDWDAARPDVLKYERAAEGGELELAVVQRTIEMPSEKGFGFNELVRITTPAGGLFGSSKIQRAVKVQRRFRRAFGKDGSRIVEGLEIVKTFRVMDGIAGTEMPTSTTKSSLRLARPGGLVELVPPELLLVGRSGTRSAHWPGGWLAAELTESD